MRKRMRKYLILPSAFIIFIIGCIFSLLNYNGNSIEKKTEYLSASWSYNYSDIEEMSKNSDLIALVTVQKKESMIVQDEIPYTIYSVRVNTPVYNSEKNQIFSIYMTGGETEEKIIEIEDDPLLKPNEKMLIFCKKNPDGTYQILNGSQGRLIYADGKLNSLNVTNATRVRQANSFSNITVRNADADMMIQEIKEYIK